jgi:hypothetical protein
MLLTYNFIYLKMQTTSGPTNTPNRADSVLENSGLSIMAELRQQLPLSSTHSNSNRKFITPGFVLNANSSLNSCRLHQTDLTSINDDVACLLLWRFIEDLEQPGVLQDTGRVVCLSALSEFSSRTARRVGMSKKRRVEMMLVAQRRAAEKAEEEHAKLREAEGGRQDVVKMQIGKAERKLDGIGETVERLHAEMCETERKASEEGNVEEGALMDGKENMQGEREAEGYWNGILRPVCFVLPEYAM